MNVQALAPIVLVLALAGCGGGDEEAASDCTPLTDEEIATIVEGNEEGGTTWKGDGEFTVTAAEKTPTDGGESGMFDGDVVYLKVDAPGIEGEVYTFIASPNGNVMGADAVTREFWTWGDAATPGSPADQNAEEAVEASGPACLS